jgi:hypothetical protein
MAGSNGPSQRSGAVNLELERASGTHILFLSDECRNVRAYVLLSTRAWRTKTFSSPRLSESLCVMHTIPKEESLAPRHNQTSTQQKIVTDEPSLQSTVNDQ